MHLQERIGHVKGMLLNLRDLIRIGADYFGELYFSNLPQLFFSETDKFVRVFVPNEMVINNRGQLKL